MVKQIYDLFLGGGMKTNVNKTKQLFSNNLVYRLKVVFFSLHV